MSGHVLDVPELYRRLEARRVQRGLSWREIARACGISSSTMTRIKDGYRPDADALVSLLVWLDMDTDIAYLIKPKETGHGRSGLGPSRRRNRITREHLEAVAATYQDAYAKGLGPTRAVSDHFDVPHSTAAKWVGHARKQGILPPVGEESR